MLRIQKLISIPFPSLLLETVTSDLSGYDLVTINCSTQLTADFVIYTLKQVFIVLCNLNQIKRANDF